MRTRKFFLITITIIAVLTFYFAGVEREPVEKVSISSAIGYDIDKKVEDKVMRNVTISVYVVSENRKVSRTIVATGNSLAQTREDRQSKMDKRFLLGFEKVYIVSEEYAKYGMRDIIDILFRTPEVRDTSLLCICKGKAEDILKMQVEGYPSSGDFIEGLVRYSREFNFFPDNYKLIDAYIRLGAEGRNLVIPCIDIKENSIQIVGLGLFKEDKLVNIVSVQEAKLINLLKENRIMGMINVEENSKKFANFYGKSRRKVECYKDGEKYKFIINLRMVGDLIGNEYDEKLINNPDTKKEFEKRFEDEIEKEAKVVIEDMKNKYKIDCLELGRIACAKYGRNTGVDWNDIVSDSDIEVKAAVEIDRFGRGGY